MELYVTWIGCISNFYCTHSSRFYIHTHTRALTIKTTEDQISLTLQPNAIATIYANESVWNLQENRVSNDCPSGIYVCRPIIEISALTNQGIMSRNKQIVSRWTTSPMAECRSTVNCSSHSSQPNSKRVAEIHEIRLIRRHSHSHTSHDNNNAENHDRMTYGFSVSFHFYF